MISGLNWRNIIGNLLVDSLTIPFMEYEVLDCIKAMDNNKTPGPDDWIHHGVF